MSVIKASIGIKQLRVTSKLGIHSWEKRWPQVIVVDAHLKLPHLPQEDTLNPQCDYATVALFIQKFCRDNPFNLLETLTEKLCEGLHKHFGFPSLKLTISKPYALPNSKGASVSLTFRAKGNN